MEGADTWRVHTHEGCRHMEGAGTWRVQTHGGCRRMEGADAWRVQAHGGCSGLCRRAGVYLMILGSHKTVAVLTFYLASVEPFGTP